MKTVKSNKDEWPEVVTLFKDDKILKELRRRGYGFVEFDEANYEVRLLTHTDRLRRLEGEANHISERLRRLEALQQEEGQASNL